MTTEHQPTEPEVPVQEHRGLTPSVHAEIMAVLERIGEKIRPAIDSPATRPRAFTTKRRRGVPRSRTTSRPPH